MEGMQIDFHHGVTYVIARLGGLSPEQAAIVAYAAQYVDDATNSGVTRFDNGAMYQRISSAHKLLDYRNFEELANHTVWIPFHFLPGNGGLPAGQDPPGGFINKLVCRPDSPVAHDMLQACIAARGHAHALHRLGIALHVYADTWAHQGFAGVSHVINPASHITGPDKVADLGLRDRLANYFLGEALPLGHGTVLSNPDKPFLCWSYVNGMGQIVERDNPRDFLSAADHMCRVVRCFLRGELDMTAPGLLPGDRQVLDHYLRNLTEPDGEKRHEHWLAAIAQGEFSFGRDQVGYQAKGEGSWKFQALGTRDAVDSDGQRFPYRPEFLRSNWKRFHDALQLHRYELLHHLLPAYGICAA